MLHNFKSNDKKKQRAGEVRGKQGRRQEEGTRLAGRRQVEAAKETLKDSENEQLEVQGKGKVQGIPKRSLQHAKMLGEREGGMQGRSMQ
jgi:hypothetical protein